jgi:hypothetical protein
MEQKLRGQWMSNIAGKTINHKLSTSLLKYNIEDKIKLNELDFRLIAEAPLREDDISNLFFQGNEVPVC